MRRGFCAVVGGTLIAPQLVWGAPLFGERRAYPVGTSPVAIAVGEFNAAPEMDLATADESDTISLLANRGDGVFSPAGYIGIEDRYTATDIASGSFNADNIDDLAVSADDSGTQTFAGSVLLYRSGGALQFTPTAVTVGLFPTCLVRADVTGDGIGDVLACATGAAGNGLISILRGRADFSFTPPVSVPLGSIVASRLAVQDLDHDGRPDMVVVDTDGNGVWVLYGGPEPTFAAPVRLASTQAPTSVVITDIGDVLPAIAVTSRTDGMLEVYRQLHPRSFEPRTSYAVGQSPVAVGAADVDGNGSMDFLVVNRASDNVTVLLGDATGDLAFGETIQVGHGPVALAVADFNGDGKIDFATADQDDASFGSDTQSVSVVLNGTTPPFTPTPSLTATNTTLPTVTRTPTVTSAGTRSPTPTPTRTISGTPHPSVTPAGPWDANCDGQLDGADLETLIARLFDGTSGCLTRSLTAADITAFVEALSSPVR